MAPEIYEAKAEEAFLESLPVAYTSGLYLPSPFGHKNSMKFRVLSMAPRC